jgi:uncharacterized protein
MGTPKTRDKEFVSLLQIIDQFPKYIVLLNDYDFLQEGGIHINLIVFLLK